MEKIEEYFQIELSRGQVARVSAEDWEELSKYKWFARWDQTIGSYYAVRTVRLPNGKQGQVAMHRQVMEAPNGLMVDHRSGKTLDNRRSELRLATPLENSRNSRLRKDNTSGYKGVFWDKARRGWSAKIRVPKQRINLGLFSTAESAYAAYCDAARKYHGDFARVA